MINTSTSDVRLLKWSQFGWNLVLPKINHLYTTILDYTIVLLYDIIHTILHQYYHIILYYYTLVLLDYSILYYIINQDTYNVLIHKLYTMMLMMINTSTSRVRLLKRSQFGWNLVLPKNKHFCILLQLTTFYILSIHIYIYI